MDRVLKPLYNEVCMVKNELDLIVKDDWLAKEKAYEARISAWDLDEGKKVRYEHEEHCDVRENAEFHTVRHQKRQKINYDATGGNEKPQSSISMWFVADIILLFVLVFITTSFFESTPLNMAALVVVFLSINPGLFIWYLLGKRFPPKFYWVMVFIIAVALEIFAIVDGLFRQYIY